MEPTGSRATAATFPFRSQASRAPASKRRLLVSGPDHVGETHERSRLEVRPVRVAGTRERVSREIVGRGRILLSERASPCHPPQHLHDNVAFRSVLLGETRNLEGFRSPLCDAERIGEEAGDRCGGAHRTHLAHGVEGPAQDRDCLVRLIGQLLDLRGDQRCDGRDSEVPAELFVDGAGLRVHAPGLVEVALHRAQARENGADGGLQEPVIRLFREILLAPRECLGDRCSTVVQRLRVEERHCCNLGRVARASCMLERSLEPLRARFPPAGVDGRLALEQPRLGEPFVIPELLEQGKRLVCDGRVIERRALGLRERAEELPLDRRAQLEPAVTGRGRGVERLGQRFVCMREVAGAHARPPEVDEQRRPLQVIGRE